MKERRYRYRQSSKRRQRRRSSTSRRASSTPRIPQLDYPSLSGFLIVLYGLRTVGIQFTIDHALLAGLWITFAATAGTFFAHLNRNSSGLSITSTGSKFIAGVSALLAGTCLFFWGVPSFPVCAGFLSMVAFCYSYHGFRKWSHSAMNATEPSGKLVEMLFALCSALAIAALPVRWFGAPHAFLAAGFLTLLDLLSSGWTIPEPERKRPSFLSIVGVALALFIVSVIVQRSDHTLLARTLTAPEAISETNRPLWTFGGISQLRVDIAGQTSPGLANACDPISANSVTGSFAGGARLALPFAGDDNDPASTAETYLHDLRYIAAQLFDSARVAALGSAAAEAALALPSFSTLSIELVYPNQATLELAKTLSGSFNSGRQPSRFSTAGSPRKFLEKGRALYDLLLLPPPHSLERSEIPALLASDNIHTVEGYNAALRRLRPGGLLSFSWVERPAGWPQFYRTLFTINQSLRGRGGDKKPTAQLVVLRNHRANRQPLITTLVSPAPLDPELLESLQTLARSEGFDLLAAPGRIANPLIAGPLGDEARFHAEQVSAEHQVKFTALTDSQPFGGLFAGLTLDIVRPVFAEPSISATANIRNPERYELFSATLDSNRSLQDRFHSALLIPVFLTLLIVTLPAASRMNRRRLLENNSPTATLCLLVAGAATLLIETTFRHSAGIDVVLLTGIPILVGAMVTIFFTTPKRMRRVEFSTRLWPRAVFAALAIISALLWLDNQNATSAGALIALGSLFGSALTLAVQRLFTQASDTALWSVACAGAVVAFTLGATIWLAPHTGLSLFPLITALLFSAATVTTQRVRGAG